MERVKQLPVISIIMPVYNTAAFLEQSIQSILNQTYKSIELILVDDGSTDGSGKLCDSFAKQDKRVVVIHKKNGGQAEARNLGLDVAKGEYICFGDSDDWFDVTMLAKLLSAIESENADIAICNVFSVDESGELWEEDNQVMPVRKVTVTGKEILEKPGTPKAYLYATLWCKLYRRQVWESVRLPIGMIHEDEYIFHEIFRPEYRVTGVAEPLYYYRINSNSTMNKTFSIKRLDIIAAYYHRFQFLREYRMDAQILHIETAGFQYLLRAFVELDAESLKEEKLENAVKMDKEMVEYLRSENSISLKSYLKRKLFYGFPRLSAYLARFTKRKDER